MINITVEGYVGHLVTTGGEWGLVISFFFYLLTYAWELRHCRVHAPKLMFHDEFLYKWKGDESVPTGGVIVMRTHYDNPAVQSDAEMSDRWSDETLNTNKHNSHASHHSD